MATPVVGAGLAGLAAALGLHQRGEEFVHVERADRVGGVVASASQDGFLMEPGPRTVAGNPPTLIEAADLTHMHPRNPFAPTVHANIAGYLSEGTLRKRDLCTGPDPEFHHRLRSPGSSVADSPG